MFSSQNFLGLQPKSSNQNLAFGTAIHAGLESYYKGKGLNQGIKDFTVSLYDSNLDDDVLYDLEYLGKGMLANYDRYASEDRSEIIKVEYSFSLPIQVTDENYLSHRTSAEFDIDHNGTLLFKDKPVHYDGTIDLLIKNPDGEYWIVDHKTAKTIYDDKFFLNTNDQITAYIWAMRKLGYPVKGFIYQELLKKIPEPIKPLKRKYKGRKYSVNIQNPVILADYITTLLNSGEDLELYKDFLQYLRLNPNPFFKRSHIERSEAELLMFENLVFFEAIDMLSPSTVMYPSPDYFGCDFCSFQDPCLAMNKNEDWEYILDNAFEPRK